jgi:hypothetical protein
LKRRILGGRADQGDGPLLDVREKRVLLRLVEVMDLVNEEHGGFAQPLQALRFVNDFL